MNSKRQQAKAVTRRLADRKCKCPMSARSAFLQPCYLEQHGPQVSRDALPWDSSASPGVPSQLLRTWFSVKEASCSLL